MPLQVALRLAQLFGLTLADLQQSGSLSTVQPGRLIECIDKCRQLGKPGLTSAIGLLKQFKVSRTAINARKQLKSNVPAARLGAQQGDMVCCIGKQDRGVAIIGHVLNPKTQGTNGSRHGTLHASSMMSAKLHDVRSGAGGNTLTVLPCWVSSWTLLSGKSMCLCAVAKANLHGVLSGAGGNTLTVLPCWVSLCVWTPMSGKACACMQWHRPTCTVSFQGLEEHFDCVAVLSQLVESGQDGLAQSWVSVLSPDLKVRQTHWRLKSSTLIYFEALLSRIFPTLAIECMSTAKKKAQRMQQIHALKCNMPRDSRVSFPAYHALQATFIHQCMAADRYKSAKNAVHALGLQD
eukprot:scaffold39371_cov19-Tisochrysis_lutea.AAC.1